VLLADSFTKTVFYWNALTRPANVLLAVDVSGSMKVAIPGTGQTRFELLKSAVTETIGMFSSSSQVGLWVFEAQQGGQSYREVVKQGRLDEVIAGVDRRKKLTTRWPSSTPTVTPRSITRSGADTSSYRPAT
jgi:hypothetical protein